MDLYCTARMKTLHTYLPTKDACRSECRGCTGNETLCFSRVSVLFPLMYIAICNRNLFSILSLGFTNIMDFSGSHVTTQWHRNAIDSSKYFNKIMDRKQLSVPETLDSAYHKIVAENRNKL